MVKTNTMRKGSPLFLVQIVAEAWTHLVVGSRKEFFGDVNVENCLCLPGSWR
jgi:hypothetical protein